jgi:CubicO group peptidase (beta-lactamase class C family)
MNISRVALLWLLLLMALRPSLAAQPSLADTAELQAWVDEFVARQMQDNRIPGAIVSIVKDGQILLSKGYGLSDIEHHRAVDPHKTLFRIASVTKTFTATAIMQQVERGNLSLDSDVRDIVDFPLPLRSSKPLRVSDLLTHRGGFENGLFGVLSDRMQEMPSLKKVLSTTMPTQVRDPGTLSSYSNHGFTLLAYVIERRTGLSMAQYLQDNLFTPLGMKSTHFEQPAASAWSDDVAVGYSTVAGQLTPHPFEIVLTAGGGAISSTADDMGRFMLAQLQQGILDGQRILSAESTQEMHKVHFSYAPGPGGMGYGFPHAQLNGHDVLWHTGALFYCYSRLVLIPDSGVGLFVAGNSDTADELQERLFSAFMQRYFPAGPPASAPQTTADPSEGEAISGVYRRSGSPITTFAAVMSLKELTTVRATRQGISVQRGEGKPVDYRYVMSARYRTLDADAADLGDIVFFKNAAGLFAGYAVENRQTSSMERIDNPFRSRTLGIWLIRMVYAILSIGMVASWAVATRWKRLTLVPRCCIGLITATGVGAWALYGCFPWLERLIREDSGWVPWNLTAFLSATSVLAIIAAAAAIVTLRTAQSKTLAPVWRAGAALYSLGALGGSVLIIFWHLFGYHYY